MEMLKDAVGRNAKLSDVIKLVQKNNFKDPWFRGQPNYDYKLVPGLFRTGENKTEIGCEYDERVMLDEFKRRYHEWGNVHRTEFEWLSLMQHYGYPTRLLDWTTNIMVAIYFACIDGDNDGSIYVYKDKKNQIDKIATKMLGDDPSIVDSIKVRQMIIHLIEEEIKSESRSYFLHSVCIKSSYGVSYNEMSRCDGSDKIDTMMINFLEDVRYICVNMFGNHYPIYNLLSFILKYNSPHLSKRMRYQHSCFTIHGGKYFKNDKFIDVNNMEDFTDEYFYDLIKIRIPYAAKKGLLEELKYAGIHEATLFPEMDRQVNSIKEMAKFAPDA